MDKIKIIFIGIGCRIAKGQFNETLWKKFGEVANIVECPLNEAFFDSSFFDVLNIKEYKLGYDLGNLLQISGLIDSYQSIIEIRVNNRKKRKIHFKELFNEDVLFPLCQTIFSKADYSAFKENCLTLVEKEIGTIAVYEFESHKFSLDKLLFSLTALNVQNEMKFMVLSKLEYEGTELLIIKSDTLVKERYAIL